MGQNSRFFMEMRIAEQAKKSKENEFEDFAEQEELESHCWSIGQCVS